MIYPYYLVHMYLFDPAPFTLFHDIAWYVGLYCVLIATAQLAMLIMRPKAQLTSIKQLISQTASRVTLFSLLGLFLIAIRLGETPWISMPILHTIPILGVLWQLYRFRVKKHTLVLAHTKKERSKQARDKLVKQTDPYLSAHQKKRK